MSVMRKETCNSLQWNFVELECWQCPKYFNRTKSFPCVERAEICLHNTRQCGTACLAPSSHVQIDNQAWLVIEIERYRFLGSIFMNSPSIFAKHITIGFRAW